MSPLDIKRIYRECGAIGLSTKVNDLVAAALDSESADRGFRYLCSDICIELKQFSEAISILEVQHSNGGLSDVGYNNVGYCYWELEDYEPAYLAFKSSLKLNPDNDSSLRGAAYCSLETDRPAESVELCQSFYERSSKTIEAALWLATALFNANRDESLISLIADRKRRFGQEVELSGFNVDK